MIRMNNVERYVLYVSQLLSGTGLAISAVGMFSEEVQALWALLRVIGSASVVMFYVTLVFALEAKGDALKRAGRPFVIATVIIAFFMLLGLLTVAEPDLHGIGSVKVFGYSFLVFLMISDVLSRLED